MSWEKTRCHHIKESSGEDSTSKLKHLADLFQFQPRSDRKQRGLHHKFQLFFPAWLLSNYCGGLVRSPSIQIPSCSAAHLKGSQELGTSPPKFSGYLATGPRADGKARETLGAADSKCTNSERFGAPRWFRHPGAPRQPLTRPTGREWGGRQTDTPCPPKTENRSGSSFTEDSERLGFSSMLGEEGGFFG